MRYCIFCGIQVSDAPDAPLNVSIRGNSRLNPTLTHWFGRRGTRMVTPVAESAMPDEQEHMAFVHGFTPISQHMVNGRVVSQGPWACIVDRDDIPHEFGEQWERVSSREGRRVA